MTIRINKTDYRKKLSLISSDNSEIHKYIFELPLRWLFIIIFVNMSTELETLVEENQLENAIDVLEEITPEDEDAD